MQINNSLFLIKEDDKPKNWALVLGGRAPTIDQFKRNPNDYDTIPHGIYRIETVLEDIWNDDNGIRVRLSKDLRIKVLMSCFNILNYINKGYVEVVDNHITIIGRFDKQGKEIIFRPGNK